MIQILSAINISQDTLSEELRNQLQILNSAGSVVLSWNDNDLTIKIVGWVGKYNLRPFINMDIRKFYLLLLGVDMIALGKFSNICFLLFISVINFFFF